ncbi:MAG: amidohydrolase family protein [Planctomycetota bacterium]
MRIENRKALLLGVWPLCLLCLSDGNAQDLVVRGGMRFDSERRAFVENSGMTIIDGTIASLDSSSLSLDSDQLLQLNDDDYILPGFVDCHAHYNVRLIRRRREEFKVMPVVYLANGVTTTFSCGEFDPDRMRELRLAIEAGEQPGPHLINSGPYFGRARPGWQSDKPQDEIRQEVRYWREQGVGGFKAKAISPEALQILVDEAHAVGLTVTGHLGSGYRRSVNPRDAIEMGIDRIEHFIGGDLMPADRSAYDSLAAITRDQAGYLRAVQQFVENQTVFDATLTAYGYFGPPKDGYDYWIDERQFFTPYVQKSVAEKGPPKVIEQFEQIYHAKLATVGTFFEKGGRLSLGTDHVSDGRYLPGFSAHRELDAFVRAGIPTDEALLIATLNGAKALGLEASRGSISPGKNADLMVIKGDPINDIRRTRTVHTVVKRGEVFHTADLLESVRGKLGPRDETENEKW